MLAFNLNITGNPHMLDITAVQQTTCTTTKYVPLHVYLAKTPLFVYGLSVLCALTTSVAGFITLGRNGMASTKNVSAIIRTTRNRTLDGCIVGGDRLGGDMMSAELEKMEPQFGVLRAGGTTRVRFALGVKGEIYPIKRD